MSTSAYKEDEHHIAFPRRLYKVKGECLEAEFRRLPCLKLVLDREVHDLIHEIYPYQLMRKVPRKRMRFFVDRHHVYKKCSCYQSGSSAHWRVGG